MEKLFRAYAELIKSSYSMPPYATQADVEAYHKRIVDTQYEVVRSVYAVLPDEYQEKINLLRGHLDCERVL